MAELTFTIFGLAVPVVRLLGTLYFQLNEISGAPEEIEIFKSEMWILRASIENFRKQCPASIKKLARSKRQEALKHAKALIGHFRIIAKSIKAAAAWILRTFNKRTSGSLKRIFASMQWTFKKSAISENRHSMTLLVGMIKLFSDSVVLEGAQEESERNGASPRELEDKIERAKEDCTLVRRALKYLPAANTCRGDGLLWMGQMAICMERRAEIAICSFYQEYAFYREYSTTRQPRSDSRLSRKGQQRSRAARSESSHRRAPSSSTPRCSRCEQESSQESLEWDASSEHKTYSSCQEPLEWDASSGHTTSSSSWKEPFEWDASSGFTSTSSGYESASTIFSEGSY